MKKRNPNKEKEAEKLKKTLSSPHKDTLVRFDWAIKRLLRHKADHTVLNGFLTSLLGRQIKIEKMLESEGNKLDEENKFNRVDMLAEDADGKKILIEVQNETENSYFHRMLFGTSKIINEYLKEGEGYEKVVKVYSINIVFFPLGQGKDYVYKGQTEFRGLHDNDLLELTPSMKEKFDARNVSDIFPEYYILRANDFDKLAITPLDQWMHLLRHNELPDNANAPGLKEAGEQLRLLSLPKAQRDEYFHYIDGLLSIEGAIDTAHYNGFYDGRQEGLAEGLAKGIEEGRAKGIEEGRAKGIEEGLIKGKWETARNLHNLGMNIEVIAQATGLSSDELNNFLS